MREAEREEKTDLSSNIPVASLHLGSPPSPFSRSLVCHHHGYVCQNWKGWKQDASGGEQEFQSC